MSTKKEIIFNGIWNELGADEKNVVVCNHLKTLSMWDLKRVICNVLDVDYMDDEGLRAAAEKLVNER